MIKTRLNIIFRKAFSYGCRRAECEIVDQHFLKKKKKLQEPLSLFE
jgi:hypothetical protein